MLQDHGREAERCAAVSRYRRNLAREYGEWVAALAPWEWFVNPVSFRDDWRNAHRPTDRPSPKSGPPCPDEALAHIKDFLSHVERQAGRPIGWMVAEQFGRLGGRFHCHALVTGVGKLQRKFWWREAFRSFGRTRIEPFDPERGAAFYASRYAAREAGALHFGGTLAGVDLSLLERGGETGRGEDLALSVDLPRSYFRLGLGRWHR